MHLVTRNLYQDKESGVSLHMTLQTWEAVGMVLSGACYMTRGNSTPYELQRNVLPNL